MKKLTLTLITVLFIAVSHAQTTTEKIKPTTQEEYNYVTKGYKIQVESGLDMKQGYSFIAIETFQMNSKTLVVKGLLREGEKTPCAMLLHYTNKDFPSTTSYMCIPTEDADVALWNQYYSSTVTFSSETARWFNNNMSKLLMRYATK